MTSRKEKMREILVSKFASYPPRDRYVDDNAIPTNIGVIESVITALEDLIPKEVASVCSKHQVADKDCPLCKIHFPFSIDTDAYCKSAGYTKTQDLSVEEMARLIFERQNFGYYWKDLHFEGKSKYLVLAQALHDRMHGTKE